MPITGDQVAPTYARLNVARLGAFRLNYYRPLTIKISIGGVPVEGASRVRVRGLSIRDNLDGEPNLATMRVDGIAPTKGQTVQIGLGTLEPYQLLFAGPILTVAQIYEGDNRLNVAWDLTCISWEWLLGRRLVNARYLSTSASAIARDIMTRFASGFTATGVQTDMPTVDEFTLTNEPVPAALDRLAKRVGGYWYIDTARDLKMFTTQSPGAAHAITDANYRRMSGLTFDVDLEPVRTRIVVEGGGSRTAAAVLAGDSMIPIEAIAWYAPGGGVVQIGPRVITYAGIVVGGAGAIVGLGVGSPASAATSAAAIGTGLSVGLYRHKVSFVTAGGETEAGPASAAVTLGVVVAPPTLPEALRGSAGGNLSAGAYQWLLTYLDSAGGETTAGAASAPLTLGPLAPPAAPSAAIVAGTSGNLLPGAAYAYKATYRAGSNETLASVASAPVTISGVDAPGAAPTGASPGTTGNVNAGTHRYKVTFVTAAGETLASVASTPINVASLAPPEYLGPINQLHGGNLSQGNYWWGYTWLMGDGKQSAIGSLANWFFSPDPTYRSANFAVRALPAGVYGRRIYRTTHDNPPTGGGLPELWQWRHVDDDIAPGDHYYFDNVADGDLGMLQPPAEGQAGNGRVSLTIPVSGDARVTGRRIYRTVSGDTGDYKLVGTVNNNVDTTFTDNVADASLGVVEPSVNTAGSGRATVTLPPMSSDSLATARRLYRTTAGGSVYQLLATITDPTQTTFADNVADGSLGAAEPSVATADYRRADLTIPTSSDGNVTGRGVYRTVAGGATFQRVATIPNNTQTTYTDNVADAALGVQPPTVPTSVYQRIVLTGVPISPDGNVTSRRIYRTVANGAVFLLAGSIANNTGATFTDSTPDGSLGAPEPAPGGSGLAIAEGVVNAGATVIPVSGTSGFPSSGWVRIQSQTIRYTGITGTTLTGIPSTGIGALLSSVQYGNEALAMAMLTGVPVSGAGAIPFAITLGEDVNVRITRNDAAAQAAMAALVGGDGIHEMLVQDRRLSRAEAENRGDAKLAELKAPIETVTYITRDISTRSGRTVTINIGAPTNVSGTFKIQSVIIDEFDARGHVPPRRTVVASTRLQSFEALLRIWKRDSVGEMP